VDYWRMTHDPDLGQYRLTKRDSSAGADRL